MLTPSGNYYEKSAIFDWIKKNQTDPMTREKLTKDMLIEDKEYAEKIILHQMVKNVINAIIKILGFQDVKVNVVFHFIDKIQFYVKVYAKKDI